MVGMHVGMTSVALGCESACSMRLMSCVPLMCHELWVEQVVLNPRLSTNKQKNETTFLFTFTPQFQAFGAIIAGVGRRSHVHDAGADRLTATT